MTNTRRLTEFALILAAATFADRPGRDSNARGQELRTRVRRMVPGGPNRPGLPA